MGTVELEYAMKDWLGSLGIWDIWIRDSIDIDLGAFQYNEELHKIDMNFWNIIQQSPRYGTTPLGLSIAVLSHELGHYIHFTKYNGLDMDISVSRATNESERNARQYRLEIRAYRHGLEYLPTEYLHVYEIINTINLEHYKKLAGL